MDKIIHIGIGRVVRCRTRVPADPRASTHPRAFTLTLIAIVALLALLALVLIAPATAQAVLFDFDNAPIHTPFPIDLTVGGITAHFSATGQGYSIQPADVMGFTPVGFAGLCIYPSSVFPADLLIRFDQTLTDFSIMFAPQELGCDDTATMRVTAYMDNVLVGTNTAHASPPGTWPTGTLSFSASQGFNRVVVHYDSRPPTCGDWGPIFMADNMNVTETTSAVGDAETAMRPFAPFLSPNPFGAETTLHYAVSQRGPVSISIYDAQGRMVRTLLAAADAAPGATAIRWDGRDDGGREVVRGVYLCRLQMNGRTETVRMTKGN
jgi:hypothetical protein